MSEQRRRELLLLAFGLAVGVLGFSAGRFSAPLQVETRVEYSDVSQRKEKTKKKTARAVDTITTITPFAIATPDGGVVIASKTVTETREREATKESTDLDAMRETLTRSSTTTTNRPDWRAGVLLGGRFSGGPAGVVAGGIVERRIVGGVSAAAWGLVEVDTTRPTPSVTAGSVGGGVMIEW